MVKNPPAMQETQVQSLSQEDPLEKGMATHSSISFLENSMDRVAWVHRNNCSGVLLSCSLIILGTFFIIVGSRNEKKKIKRIFSFPCFLTSVLTSKFFWEDNETWDGGDCGRI